MSQRTYGAHRRQAVLPRSSASHTKRQRTREQEHDNENHSSSEQLAQLPAWIQKCNVKLTLVPFADDKVITQVLAPEMIKYYDSLLAPYFDNSFDTGSPHPLGNVASSNTGKRDGFPGSLAQSLLRKDFAILTDAKEEYKILLKSDGIRSLMFVFEYEDNTRKHSVVALVDRTFSWKIATVAFAKPMYQGTVFDGELVRYHNGTFVYQIFDVIGYCGNYVGKEPHSVRLSLARKCIESEQCYKYNPKHTFAVSVKDYVTADEAVKAVSATEGGATANNANLSYPIDGLILVSEHRPYLPGQDPYLFKYKRAEHHTVDLKMSLDQSGRPSLFALEDGNLKTIQSPANIDKSCLRQLQVGNERMLVNRILECSWDSNGQKWVPLKCRFDKNMPNNVATLKKTIENRREAITPEELYQVLSHRSRVGYTTTTTNSNIS